MFYPELPDGWFSGSDIASYRRLVAAVPEGSTIAELGVWKGRSLCSVADLIRSKRLNVLAVDCFLGSENEPALIELARREDLAATFARNLRAFGIDQQTRILRASTIDAARSMAAGSLALVFVDASHTYEAVRADIEAWKPRLMDGGVMAGHDATYPSVITAVREFFPDAVTEGNIWIGQC